MVSAKYQTTLESFARPPVTLIKLTITGDVAGTQIFRFSNREALPINLQLGVDVFPYLRGFTGRPTRVRPDQSVTERSNVSISFDDDNEPPDFDSSVFSITTGGSFWKRLFLAQPDFIGSPVEILRGFVEPGFTESDFEVVFTGRLEDFTFQNDGSVTLKAKDNLVLTNKESPSQISDNNLIDGAVASGDDTFTVDTGSEITTFASLGSVDQMPIVLRLSPGLAAQEDIIITDVTTNTVTVQSNFVLRSEEFNLVWTGSAEVVVEPNVKACPWGNNVTADKLTFPVVGNEVSQDIAAPLVVTSETWVFSVWIKGDSSGTITLIVIDDAGTGADSFTLQVTVETFWKRFELQAPFTATAVDDPRVAIKRDTGDLESVFAWGAQFEERSTRGFYVATTDFASSGLDAGRGSFGTTAASHLDDAKFIEVLHYRDQLTEFGVHPTICIRDLLSRSGIGDSQLDETVFGGEFDADDTLSLRRSKAAGVTENTIAEPEKISDLIKEVRAQSLLDVWIDETGLARTKSPLTILPGDSVKIATDEANVIDASQGIKANTDQRATRVLVYFNIKSGAEGDKPADFDNVRINVDLGVEALSGIKSKAILSKWIFRSEEAGRLASNLVSRFKRGAKTQNVVFEMKDDINFIVGSIVALNSDGVLVTNTSGGVERGNTFWQVTQKILKEAVGQINIEMVLISDKRICFIAPAIAPTGTFPEDYDNATTEQRIFCWIGTATVNKLGNDSDDGYVIL